MTETITVKDVERKPSGWVEVSLEDGRTVATKNSAIAELAFSTRGTPQQAVIGTSQKGKFTNYYLNALGEVSDKPAGSGNGAKSASAIPQAAPAANAVQERIARQWAYGRAVELLVASGAEFSLPLDAKTQKVLDTQAATLLEKTA